MTIPSKLILLRIFAIPMFLAFLFSDLEFGRAIALGIFIIASITDLFDGIIARKYNQMTDFVKIMDPLADKLLICSALIALVQTHDVAAWLAILIVFRDFIITGLRMVVMFRGVVLGAVISGKINTAFQMVLVIFVLADFDWATAGQVKQILIYIVVLLTVVSTAENFIRNRKLIRHLGS